MTDWTPAPDVLADTIDGEVVAIHLRTGHYHSLRGTAADIWDAVAGGASTAEVGQELARRHGVDAGAAADVAGAFLTRLAAAELVTGPALDAAAIVDPPTVDGLAVPELESFTDLEEMMLLDPVHDVDERGWPHAAPPA